MSIEEIVKAPVAPDNILDAIISKSIQVLLKKPKTLALNKISKCKLASNPPKWLSYDKL